LDGDIILSMKLYLEVGKRTNEYIEKSMSKDGLVGASWMVLMMLYSVENEDVYAKDICENLAQNKATLSRIVESLVKKGFVIYSELENDRRKNILKLTEDGKIYIKDKIIEHSKFFNKLYDGVNRESVKEDMTKLLNNIIDIDNKRMDK
jgi:DNA-binding MarR family transcriptional regulator